MGSTSGAGRQVLDVLIFNHFSGGTGQSEAFRELWWHVGQTSAQIQSLVATKPRLIPFTETPVGGDSERGEGGERRREGSFLGDPVGEDSCERMAPGRLSGCGHSLTRWFNDPQR